MLQVRAPWLVRSARRVLRVDGENWPASVRPGEVAWDRWGRRHVAGAEALLRLRSPRRRLANAPLLEELLHRTARSYAPAAIGVLARHLPEHADVLTASCVERVLRTVLRSWNRRPPGLTRRQWAGTPAPGEEWDELEAAMAAAGLAPGLWELVIRILAEADREEHDEFRTALGHRVCDLKWTVLDEQRAGLLAAVGPLDEAGWWCEYGDAAFEDSRLDRAEECWARANELGHPAIARRSSVLSMERARELVTDLFLVEDRRPGETSADELRARVSALLRSARELDPRPDRWSLLCLLAFARAAGVDAELGTDLRDLGDLGDPADAADAADPAEPPEPEDDAEDRMVRAFWLGLGHLDHGEAATALTHLTTARDLYADGHPNPGDPNPEHPDDEDEEGDASGGRELIRLLLGAAANGSPVDWTPAMLDGLWDLLPWARLPPSPLELLAGEAPA